MASTLRSAASTLAETFRQKHNVKLGADPVELTKLMVAFKTIQDALSL